MLDLMNFFRACCRCTSAIPTIILLGGVCHAGAARATEILVDGPASLTEALVSATAGTTLVLAPGDYGVLSMRGGGGAWGRPVVLRATGQGGAVRFSGMELRDTAHLTLEGVVFDYTFIPGDKIHLRPFQIIGAQNITIRRAVFDGDIAVNTGTVDAGYPTAFGLGVSGARDIRLEQSEIRMFFRGIVVSDSQNIAIVQNDLHGLRMDGMNFAQVRDVQIEGNHIHDFQRALEAPDHADMIQFWTNGTDAPSTDIMIRDNVLESGDGAYTQSIFMRNDLVDRGLAGPEMFYRNVTISQNVIINAHLHGITVGETSGLTITNNTVVRNPASEGPDDNIVLWMPQIRVAEGARDVRIAYNVVAKIAGFADQVDWSIADNLFVQDNSRARDGFYEKVFMANRPDHDMAYFVARDDGPLDSAEVGAARLDGPTPRVAAGLP
jgi:hypothetical protein